jgi:uncharacterized protein
MRKILIGLIKIYQVLLSPYMGRNCRFYPSCSNFAIEAIRKFGVKGLFISVRRVLKCHPFNAGGYDPVENWIK